MTQQVALRRAFTHAQVTIVVNTCESGALDVRDFPIVQVRVPDTWTGASLGIKVAPVKDTVFQPLLTESAGKTILVQCSSVQAGRTYTLPAAAGASGFIRIWSQNYSGVNVNQGAARVLGVTLKG
jgi:hypothetical protein